MSEKLQFDANLPGLLNEVLSNQTCAILKIPIRITKGILAELAQTAIEINDDRLHLCMLRLGLYDVSASERVAAIKEIKAKPVGNLDDMREALRIVESDAANALAHQTDDDDANRKRLVVALSGIEKVARNARGGILP